MSDKKEPEKKEAWLNWLALTTILFSTCATISTFRGGGHSTKAVLAQNEATDNWGHYQAKSIKQTIYERGFDLLEVEAARLEDESPEAAKAVRARMAKYADEIARYTGEKKEIEVEARASQKERRMNQEHGRRFGMAVVFLQMAIMLSALAALLKKRPIWYLGTGLGIYGVAWFVNGFFLFW